MLHKSWFSVGSEANYFTFTAENIGEFDMYSIPSNQSSITVGDYTYTIVDDIDSLPDKFMSEDRTFVINTFIDFQMDYSDRGGAVKVEFLDPESGLELRAYVTFRKYEDSCLWVGVSQRVSSY